MNSSKLYLCKADRSIIGTITGIKPETCSLTRNATDLWEITFDVDRYIEADGCLVQSDYYDSIDDMMKLCLDSSQTQVFFVIDSEPIIKGEGLQETKTVSAHSIECELSHMYLQNLKVNCGTADSQEFLLTNKDGNLVNNINAYNPKTMRWVDLINYEEPQLSTLHLALQNTGWTVKENIPNDICALRGSFESSDSVYSFLMKTVSPALSVLFEFDRKNKQIGVVKAADYGKDTGIFVTMRNLMNSFEVTSSSEDSIMTKLVPSGADNLGIEQVNFGKDFILNLDYFMNTVNEYGDYKYVSAELHDKYHTWKNYRDAELVSYTFKGRENKEFEGTRRELYRELTKEYNRSYSAVNERKNRVPNDGCFIDYGTFSLEELEASLTAYNNALAALLTLYKNDIIEKYRLPFDSDYPDDPEKSTQITIHEDYSLTIIPEPAEPISPALLPDTDYWYDYYAYREAIIPKVEEAIKAFENPDYTPQNIDAYLYQWDLYGLDELESKKKAWKECADILYKECFIKSKSENQIVYRTADDNGWNEIADFQSEFTSKDAFIRQLNQYLDYMYNRNDETERYNSLTKAAGDGVLVQCEKAIQERKEQIRLLEAAYETYNTARNQLADSADLKLITINEEPLFTAKELDVISSMLRTKDYSNEYILTTSLDTVVTAVDVQEELYQAAQKELEQLSQPQYSFRTELDNLYALEEFQAYREPFDVGNFIRVGLEIHEDLYDNDYIKLRLISITHNPLENGDNLSVTFSTMTKSLNTISDLAFLLDSQNAASGGSTSSSSSGGGTYGDNDADVQMSNTMLNALLKTELFGTAVNDVILDSLKANKGNFHTLFSHSGAFDSLEAGQVKISGDCLFDRVKSRNWNGTATDLLGNSQGSVIDLENGRFNFGGGSLKWDNSTLTVKGHIIADSLTIGESTSVEGLSTSNLEDGENILSKGVGIGTQNEEHSSNYVRISEDGALIADNAVIHGTIYATDGKFSGEVEATSGTFNGTVHASDGSFTGNVTATTLSANQSGSIAGWNFNSNAFYKNSNSFGNSSGMYLGNDGFSVKDVFKVDANGNCIANSFSSNNISITGGNLSFQEEFYDYLNTQTGKVFKVNDNGIYFSTGDILYLDGPAEGGKNIYTNDEVDENLEYISFYDSPVDFYPQYHRTIDMRIIKIKNKTLADGSISSLCPEIQFYGGIPSSESYIYHKIGAEGIEGASYKTMLSIYDTGFSWKLGEILQCTGAYEQVSFSGLSKRTLYVGSDGTISAASSSRRYKQDITTNLDDIFNPHSIYHLPVCQFRYNEANGGGDNSPLYIGFLAEDVAKYYPAAARWNKDNTEVDTWEMSDMFPAVVKLVQEQHEAIEELKKEIESLKEKARKENTNGKQ